MSIFIYFFIVFILLLLSGIIFEQYTRWKLEKKVFKGKTFVEINGKPLHYVKKGQGNCTVVFQSGMGSSHAIWNEIQNTLSQDTVTISYDRNGIMFSESTGLPVTNTQVAEELQILLEKTQCPKPYILVGHSMAGIYLRPFISKNQADISGIIFAEATHPKQIEMSSAELLKALKVPPRWLIKFVLHTGIYRWIFSFKPLSPEIPMNHHLHIQERDFFYRSCNKVLEELDRDDMNLKDGEQYVSFGKIPLTVIIGKSEIRYAGIKRDDVRKEYRLLLDTLQHDLLNLSSNSRMVKAANSGHILQIHDAPLLITEIRRFL